MEPDWQPTALADVVEQITVGHVGPMAHEYVTEGVPFLRSQNVTGSGLDATDSKFVSAEFHERLWKSSLAAGDVVVVRTGRPGAAAVVPPDLGPANCSDLVIIRPGEQVVSHFLAAFINSVARHQIAANLVGAVQQHFNVSAARRLELKLPPVKEQRAIASVLTALDDKVESNRRLAEAARQVLLLAVSSGGEPQSIDEIASFKNGGALTKGATGGGRPILRIKELKAGVTGDTPRTDVEVREDYEVEAGDLLFSWSGTLITHRWSGESAVLNQHIFRVDPRDGVRRWFVEAWIERHLPEFRRIAADKATTMGHIQRRHLTEALVAVPDASTMQNLRDIYDPIDALRMVALSETQTLIGLREALLPKLVSGRIRVPLSDDLEEQVA